MTNKTSRRDALKALTAATGALSLAALPDEWTTPVINAGALPPHAQTSPCYDLIITWQTSPATGTAEVSSSFSPQPDETSGAASSGYARWLCDTLGPFCLGIPIIVSGVQNAVVAFESRSGSSDENGFQVSPVEVFFYPFSGDASFTDSCG